MLPFWPELGPPGAGHIPFHWAKLHPYELHCTLLSYDAPYWATMHPPELSGTLVSYAEPSWATLHPTKLCCIQLIYAAPSELSCTLLS